MFKGKESFIPLNTEEALAEAIIASIRGKKTHVYRIAGMIASIRGKKPHVYHVMILKQFSDV